ncbi:MAG: Rrf2 family transcriptional regulator [Sphingomonadales bacterium]
MLSQKAKYALKALLVLAERPVGVPVQVVELAEAGNIPRKFLELIMLELKKHGILYSQRGKHGGYMLARSSSEITFGDIVRAMDGPLAPIPCASLTAYRKCADCTNEKTCAVRIMMRRVRDAASEVLDNTSIADMGADDIEVIGNQQLSA